MSVIASEAKQSTPEQRSESVDCFASLAMTESPVHIEEFSCAAFFVVGDPFLLSMAFAVIRLRRKGKPHRIAIQVDQNDPQVMNLALNNATNVIEYYRARNEDVDVDIVTYGPGLHMLRADTSPVQDRIKRLKDMAFPGKIQFSACNNTKQGMEKAEGHADLDPARRHHRAVGRRPPDGIAGAGLELCATVTTMARGPERRHRAARP